MRVIRIVTIILCLFLSHSLACQRRQKEAVRDTTFQAIDVSAEKEFAQRAREHKRQWELLVRQGQYEMMRGTLVDRYKRSASDITVKTLSSKLAREFEPGTAVLFYHFGVNTLHIWLIDHVGLRAYQQMSMSGAELDAAINELRNALGVRALQRKRVPPNLRAVIVRENGAVDSRRLDDTIANLTGRLLPPPIAATLVSVRHLIVVPASGIGTVPFGLLMPFGSGNLLLESMSVTIAPSLYEIMPGKWDGVIRRALIVGNPALPAEWEDLPAAEREAAEVARVLGIKHYLTGREATKEKVVFLVRQSRLDLLYLATHGVADNDNPMKGGFIALAGPGGSESRWTAREIQKRGMPVKLVVLSACQTGLGKELDAGISGLARAFHLAGSPRVVMSLWSVYDDSTAELMSDFVSRLRNHPPAEALRLSMLELRKKRPDPAHWAAFSLFGTPL